MSRSSVCGQRKTTQTNKSEAFLFEVHLTAVLNHPRIVRVLALFTTTTPLMVALELMDGGDLRSYLKSAEPKPAPLLLTNVCWQVASALGYLKSRIQL